MNQQSELSSSAVPSVLRAAPAVSRRRQPVIAQVNGTFGGGGAERAAYNLALCLQQSGVTSMCIALKDLGGDAVDETRMATVALHADRGGKVGYLRAMFRFRRLVKRHRIDLLHVHGTNTLPFVTLAVLGMRRPPAVWCTWHNSECVVDEKGFYRKLMIRSLRRCAGISASSPTVARRLVEAAGLSSVPTLFRCGIPDALDDGATPQSHRDDDDDVPTILWMARLLPSKDPQSLIRAAAQLRDEGLRFKVVIAGAAPPGMEWCPDECRRMVAEYKLGDVVEFPGWVNDTRPFLRAASIGVQTSHFEGFSLTLQEQMMAGMAIVATDVGDTRRGIEHGVTGLMIQKNDLPALVGHLRELITDRGRRRTLGAAARARALAEYSLARSAAQTLSEYRRVIPHLEPVPGGRNDA